MDGPEQRQGRKVEGRTQETAEAKKEDRGFVTARDFFIL